MKLQHLVYISKCLSELGNKNSIRSDYMLPAILGHFSVLCCISLSGGC
jgi:hypothetical protein